MASTGARPEAISELKLKDVEDMTNSCKSLILYPGTNHQMTTFLHMESSKIFSEYIDERKSEDELLKPSSYVIRNNNDSEKSLSVPAIDDLIKNIMNRAKIKRNRVGNRYDLAVTTSIRKRFNTILKTNPSISYAIAEHLMDHDFRLEGHYLRPEKEQIFEQYCKAIPELTISDEARKEVENQELRKKAQGLETKNQEIKKSEKKIENLENKIKSMDVRTELILSLMHMDKMSKEQMKELMYKLKKGGIEKLGIILDDSELRKS